MDKAQIVLTIQPQYDQAFRRGCSYTIDFDAQTRWTGARPYYRRTQRDGTIKLFFRGGILVTNRNRPLDGINMSLARQVDP